MKKIIIADDHLLVRQGIKRILSYKNEFSVVAEASSVLELRNVLKVMKADVLILDISMPDGGPGIESLEEIKRDYPNLPVLILSTYGEDQFGLLAFRAGAGGYLNKEHAPEQLVEALNEITKGKNYFGKRI